MTRKYVKHMSDAETSSCEWALQDRCACRCNGALHGAAHALLTEEFNQLLDEQGEVSDVEVEALVKQIVAGGNHATVQTN